MSSNDRDFIKEDEVAEFLNIAAQTLRNWRYQKRGPDYFKVGGRILYTRTCLEQYLAECYVKNG